jgi:hypothetical protein
VTELLTGQLVICCRIKLNSLRHWYIESAFTRRLAWTGSRWAGHVDGVGIRHHISTWAYHTEAELHAKEQGFVVIH